MKKETSVTAKIELLDTIQRMVKPLNPPVQAFETSIRETPYRVLISVLLSSRTKDAVTHKASGQLFAAADSPDRLAQLSEARIAELIFPVGFYKQKSKQLKRLGQMLTDQGGDVPKDLESLTALPGVGRKTANLVMALAFGIPAIAVDIHVFRISQRLGWAKGDKPEIIETQLRETFPPHQWNRINQTLVGFGQTLCKPINPSCHLCAVTADCLYYQENKKNGS